MVLLARTSQLQTMLKKFPGIATLGRPDSAMITQLIGHAARLLYVAIYSKAQRSAYVNGLLGYMLSLSVTVVEVIY